LWVNRLDAQKGFPIALAAFTKVLAEVPDAVLVVVGDGKDREALALLMGSARARVDMRGAQPNERVPSFLAACEVFVSPAVGQESFGIALVEAMAAGLPVVATDIPGYREVVSDGVEGLLVSPRDPEALAAGLVRVLTVPGLAARLGEAGRERARTFDWPIVVDRLEELYGRAIESAGYHRQR
jgi:phosphatidylinositol alpha-mannosyltransferase